MQYERLYYPIIGNQAGGAHTQIEQARAISSISASLERFRGVREVIRPPRAVVRGKSRGIEQSYLAAPLAGRVQRCGLREPLMMMSAVGRASQARRLNKRSIHRR